MMEVLTPSSQTSTVQDQHSRIATQLGRLACTTVVHQRSPTASPLEATVTTKPLKLPCFQVSGEAPSGSSPPSDTPEDPPRRPSRPLLFCPHPSTLAAEATAEASRRSTNFKVSNSTVPSSMTAAAR